jgi:hypothetical protein
MNIALEKTVEYVGGQVKNRYGDVFIRGNNGLSPLSRKCTMLIEASVVYISGCAMTR